MPSLNTKKPVGNGVSVPQYKKGVTMIVPSSANGKKISYYDGTGDTATGPNLSAKYKYPNVRQEVPEAGQNQYMQK